MTISRAVPMAITTHAQSGVSGCIAGGGDGGDDGGVSVWKLVNGRTLWLGVGDGNLKVRELMQTSMKLLRPIHVETNHDLALTSVTQV